MYFISALDIPLEIYLGHAKVRKVKLQALTRQYKLVKMKNDEKVAD